MQVDNVSFSYGTRPVLCNVSFDVPEGKILTILGANGSGKSTLLSLMTKSLTPKDGRILLEETDIAKISLKQFARKVAIVNQANIVNGDITVEKLVSYGRTPFLQFMGRMGEEDERLVEWAMEITDCLEYRDRPIGKLSGGQKQRAWIAMALAQNTKLLFLDEPTTYLDIRYQIEILRLVRKLNEEFGITIVMVLQDMNQAIYYSDEIIALKEGHIKAQGLPADVITPDTMEEVYGIHLDVMQTEDKKPFVLQV